MVPIIKYGMCVLQISAMGFYPRSTQSGQVGLPFAVPSRLSYQMPNGTSLDTTQVRIKLKIRIPKCVTA